MRPKFSVPVLFFLLLLLSMGMQAQQASSPEAQKILDLTNQARSEHGLQPLQWDATLAVAAQTHAQRMLDQRTLTHQLQGEPDLPARAGQAGAHFHTIAENVATGANAEALQKEWMNSAPHRANILDPRLDHVGIGVAGRSGSLYAAVVFDSSVASMGTEQAEQKIADLLRQRGVDPSRLAEAARKDCALESGDASGSRPLFIMRWEGSDLSRLPDSLGQRLGTGRYKTAAVGACSSGGESQGFTSYRIAVLLY